MASPDYNSQSLSLREELTIFHFHLSRVFLDAFPSFNLVLASEYQEFVTRTLHESMHRETSYIAGLTTPCSRGRLDRLFIYVSPKSPFPNAGTRAESKLRSSALPPYRRHIYLSPSLRAGRSGSRLVARVGFAFHVSDRIDLLLSSPLWRFGDAG